MRVFNKQFLGLDSTGIKLVAIATDYKISGVFKIIRKSDDPSLVRIKEPNGSFLQSIPESIIKYIKGRSSNETAILKRGSQKWSVKVIDWVFGKGWDIFVKENGVQEYDIIIFKHEGNMVFDTMVFDPSFCEREYPYTQVTRPSRKCENDTNAPKKTPKEKDPVPPDHIHHRYFIGTLT